LHRREEVAILWQMALASKMKSSLCFFDLFLLFLLPLNHLPTQIPIRKNRKSVRCRLGQFQQTFARCFEIVWTEKTFMRCLEIVWTEKIFTRCLEIVYIEKLSK